MLNSLIAIAVLHWAVLLIPGFNFVLIGQLAAGGRRSAALAAVAGMTTATLIWAALAVMGVGIVFSAHPLLRQAAQLAGGLYLLHLAIKLWRAGGAGAAAAGVGSMSRGAAFRAGLLTSLLNPKIALFYGSVFATALPAEPAAVMVAAAVVLVYANSIVWHGFLALALSQRGVRQAWLRHQRALNKLSGALVGGFGLRMLAVALQEWRARAA